MRESAGPVPTGTAEADLAERLQWLLRLRWLVVPAFVAVDLANDLLMRRRAPWTALAVGGVLLAANGIYSRLLARGRRLRTLLRWARFESALVVSIPVAIVMLHGDPLNALRYGVIVGVVGAAVVLPRSSEVAVVGTWAVLSLVVADAVALGFDPGRVTRALVARWATEAGVIVTVAIIAGYLDARRELVQARLTDAQDRLEKARHEWETAFDGVHEMVVIADARGAVVRANRAFAHALGLRPHELAGRPLAEVLAGHPAAWWSEEATAIREIEDPLLDTVFQVSTSRSGDRVVRVARDVGEQRRLYARLVQADKLAALGALATGVAHEINNPTASVTSNLTEIRRYLAAYEGTLAEISRIGVQAGIGDELGAVLQRAEIGFSRREAPVAVAESLQGMERVRRVVTNLRSLARSDQAGEPAQPVSLVEVVETVARTAAHDLRAARAEVTIRHACWVLGHRGQLVDVVLNLVVNAIQAREEGRPNRVGVELSREGSSAVVRVSDTGKGIAPKNMKRLFEPFFTTKAPGEGTGLGLSVARGIVLSHGGSIDMASELGRGSTFTVRLPLLEAEAAAAALVGA